MTRIKIQTTEGSAEELRLRGTKVNEIVIEDETSTTRMDLVFNPKSRHHEWTIVLKEKLRDTRNQGSLPFEPPNKTTTTGY